MKFPTLWGRNLFGKIYPSFRGYLLQALQHSSVTASQNQPKKQAHGPPWNELWHVPTHLGGRCTFGWCTLHLVCVVVLPKTLYAQLLKRNNWEGGRDLKEEWIGSSWPLVGATPGHQPRTFSCQVKEPIGHRQVAWCWGGMDWIFPLLLLGLPFFRRPS